MKVRVMLAAFAAGWVCLNSVFAATLADENEEAAPGLYQKNFSASFDKTSDPVSGGTVVPGALVASCPGSSYIYNGTTYSYYRKIRLDVLQPSFAKSLTKSLLANGGV